MRQYEIKSFFDGSTFTLTYIVSDPATKDAVIIDPAHWKLLPGKNHNARKKIYPCMHHKFYLYLMLLQDAQEYLPLFWSWAYGSPMQSFLNGYFDVDLILVCMPL